MLASAAEQEAPGSSQYQTDHMKKIFSEGFSFSGFERDKLYWNNGGKGYVDLSGISGVDSLGDGRGAAYADLDNDGDHDIFVTNLQRSAHELFRNEVGQDSGFLRISLEGRESGRDAFGSIVRVGTADGVRTKLKLGGSGFISQSDPRLLFGLGKSNSPNQVKWIEVQWPSGRKERHEKLSGAQSLRIVEGKGVYEVSEKAFSLPEPLDQKNSILASLRVKKGDPFPAIPLVDLRKSDGGSFREVRRPGHRYLVNLWATYCAPCRKEMPELEKRYKSLKDAGIELVGISLDVGRPEAVRRYVESEGYTYPIYTAGPGIVEMIYAGTRVSIPLSFLLNEKGEIVEILSGWSPSTESRIDALLAPPSP